MIRAAPALGALLAAGPPPLPEPQTSPDDARRLADEILARDEFAPPDRSAVERAARWVLDQIGDAIAWVFERIFGSRSFGGAGGSGGSNIFTLLLLAAALVAVVLVVRAVVRNRVAKLPADDADVTVDVEERRSVAEWDAAAAQLEAEGRWKEAMRCRFRSLVERLVAEGTVPDVPGRTAGEYRGDVSSVLPERAGDFATAAELFERAWYGDLPTGPGEARAFHDSAERVLAGAGAARPGA